MYIIISINSLVESSILVKSGIFLTASVAESKRKFKDNGQKRELPVLFGQKRMYSENNSGRECCWPYLIGQHPLSPAIGQKRPGTPGNSYFAQLPPVFGHFMFRFWPFYVPFLAILCSFPVRYSTARTDQHGPQERGAF